MTQTGPPAPYEVPVYTEWPNKPSQGDELSEWHVHNYVRLLDHVGKMMLDLEQAAPTNFPVYTPHRMTYLKLLMCASYARTFLKVGSLYTNDLRYLDVLAASGLSKPGNGKHAVPGSCVFTPLAWQDFKAPATAPQHRFTKAWAFDELHTNLDAVVWRQAQLAQRAGFQLPPMVPMPGNANVELPKLLQQLGAERTKLFQARQKAPLYLGFIDNEGLDVHMATIAEIQKQIRADLIIHVPTFAIGRLIAQEATLGNNPKALNAFFGNERWREAKNEDDLARIYVESVRAHTDAELQVLPPVPIKGKQSGFHLVVCTRQSSDSGDKGWVSRNERIAAASSKFDVDKMDAVLDKVLKGQKGLFSFG